MHLQTMKTLIVSSLVAAVFFAGSFVQAQDPGFRAPAAPAKPEAPRNDNSSTGGTITGAAVLTSMERLDDQKPIQPRYVISIRILEDRKEAVQQKVAVTGEVQVPYIGLVRAEGKTCRQLAYEIKKELEKSYFITATVVIAIDDYPINDPMLTKSYEIDTYTVFGFVLRQGKYDIPATEDVTISQAILKAGGFAAFADPEHVKIVRTTPTGNKSILVNVDSIMRKGEMHKDIYLRRNDVIIIPEKTINF